MCGERMFCGKGETRSVGRWSCKALIATLGQNQIQCVEGMNLLSPSLRFRSFRRCCLLLSICESRHGEELVNQFRETDACLGRKSAMVLWYRLSASTRGIAGGLAKGNGSWVRAELEKRRIRPRVIWRDHEIYP